jgi:hypothetical protein
LSFECTIEKIFKLGANVKKIFFIFAIFSMFFSAAQLRAELSLEAKQAVEEIRSRLNKQAETLADEAATTQVAAKDKYIVGKELGQALKRLRNILYSSTNTRDTDDFYPDNNAYTKKMFYKKMAQKFRKLVKKNRHSEKKEPGNKRAINYEPGKSLRKALDKVKKTHASIDIHTFEFEVDSGFAAEPGHYEGGLQEKDFEKVDAAVISDPEPPSINNDLNDSLQSQLNKDQPETSEEPEPENLEINKKLRKYEFYMPGNYRIIVR